MSPEPETPPPGHHSQKKTMISVIFYNSRKIVRIAPMLTIFGPKSSQRRDHLFEKFANERKNEQTNETLLKSMCTKCLDITLEWHHASHLLPFGWNYFQGWRLVAPSQCGNQPPAIGMTIYSPFMVGNGGPPKMDMFSSIFDRTDLRIGASGAKFDEKADFDVWNCLAPPKSRKITKTWFPKLKKIKFSLNRFRRFGLWYWFPHRAWFCPKSENLWKI